MDGGRLSYAEITRSMCPDKNSDFPSLKSQGKLSRDRSKDRSKVPQVEYELDNDEFQLLTQKEVRSGWLMLRKREQLIGDIVNKLRSELRVDILRIIREEVRQNLRMIIDESIREEVRSVLSGDGSAIFRETARELVEENIRERVVRSLNEECIESESETVELFKKITE